MLICASNDDVSRPHKARESSISHVSKPASKSRVKNKPPDTDCVDTRYLWQNFEDDNYPLGFEWDDITGVEGPIVNRVLKLLDLCTNYNSMIH